MPQLYQVCAGLPHFAPTCCCVRELTVAAVVSIGAAGGVWGWGHQTFNVCALCYELHQRELALLVVEQEFSQVIGAVTKYGGDGAVTPGPGRPLSSVVTGASQRRACTLWVFFTLDERSHGKHTEPVWWAQ